MDLQFLQAFLGTTVDKVKKFDYKRLIPRGRMERYSYAVAGIELTWPWRKEGLGIGIGLGVIDIWVGWPRLEENLHTEDCKHDEVQVEEKQPSLAD
jgi:hypothetical protein